MTRRHSLFGMMTLASGLSSCSLVPKTGPRTRPAATGPAPRAPLGAGTAASLPQRIVGPTRASYSSCRVPGPFIALTFDDGPQPQNTPRLLGMLRERGVKGTFFVIGRSVQAYPRVLQQTYADGHEIAGHTLTHASLSRLSDAGVARELTGGDAAIASALGGYKPQVFRPPYGAITARQKEWVHSEFGYPSILWSVDPLDWKIRNTPHVASALIGGARPGGILLCHDLHATTVSAIPQVLDTLLARGYQFVTVSQLINLENGAVQPAPPAVMRFTAGSL